MMQLDYGIAQARIVYKDYMFIEEELRSSYHHQNRFCYTLDSKASADFRDKMRQLPSCLPNVYVASEEFNISSSGRSMNKAHLACLKLLIELPGWNYVMLLQNHDVIIKSVYEIAEIYDLFGGANDVELNRLPFEMYDNDMNWNAKTLKLFGNKSRVKHSRRNAQLHFAKGVVQASLSRAAVDWLVNKVNLTTVFHLIEHKPYFDEVLLPSLQISDELGMPGRFSYKCHKKGYAFAITR
ncbi:Core-2/I-Branching enzyme [Oesophagostomum dentatum]|uniref:Core-2/I-Branching enzyme n=1 Tax=Oesophagostomum dentatum TaxID=61180 RepID=A0A0B1TBU0_OESDE|nr:Core-2/I-Branching enzyme [Oesophagostomum dentatum]